MTFRGFVAFRVQEKIEPSSVGGKVGRAQSGGRVVGWGDRPSPFHDFDNRPAFTVAFCIYNENRILPSQADADWFLICLIKVTSDAAMENLRNEPEALIAVRVNNQ